MEVKSYKLRGKNFLLFTFYFSLLMVLTATLIGCSGNVFEDIGIADKDSREAKLEDARIALDKGEWAKAISILEGMDKNDPTVAAYLSNARAGKAGLNTFTLLETIDKLTTTKKTGGIDMVGSVLGGEDSTLTKAEIEEKISDFNSAIDALSGIPVQDRTEEQNVQLGLLSLNRAALTIAETVRRDQQKDEITLTNDGLADLYRNQGANFDNNDITPAQLENLATDITNIGNSIDAILSITGQTSDQQNDLSNNFKKFKDEVDNGGVGGVGKGDGEITAEELEYYINNISKK